MKKTILVISTAMILVTACGGSKSPNQGSAEKSTSDSNIEEVEDTITISGSNKSHMISPTEKQYVKITGSNNLITINTSPLLVRIIGNDNTVKIENKGKVRNTGSGNMILSLTGSVSTI
jgi:hypothetical protein